ncbi:hypothetical protein [Croceicoccus bisphenolivorans]|uniref:hypothetical protein n=1 Tax=Croceicoccus bisphenolivorans TaxID=1783232 RepID=UPI0009EE37A9|nr:hypothetical protein [Croceicoccus bisphenolivorans]
MNFIDLNRFARHLLFSGTFPDILKIAESLAAMTIQSRNARKPNAERSTFSTFLDSAAQQIGYSHVTDHDNNVRATIQKPAALVDHVAIGDLELPDIGNTKLRATHFPIGREAGKNSKLSAALLEASRVAGAGARIIPVPEMNDGRVVNGETIFLRQTMHFDLIEAAPFAPVADDADAPDSALPFFTAPIDIGETANLAFRVKLTRADRRAYEAGYLSDVALASICLGIARAADKVLLDAIAATTPAAFNLGAAAALGFKFSELRALVGTASDGASVGQDGALRASGIPAELTPAIAGTVVGSFSRSAVAISERISLVAERANINGDLNLTCWANMEALLPMPGAFWTVGA